MESRVVEERVKTHQFRQELAKFIADIDKRPVVVMNRNEDAAVMISPRQYRLFMYMMSQARISPV